MVEPQSVGRLKENGVNTEQFETRWKSGERTPIIEAHGILARQGYEDCRVVDGQSMLADAI